MNAVESIRIKNINNGVLFDANIDIPVGQITTILGPSGEGLYDFLKPVILSHSEKIYNTFKNSQFLPTGNYSGIDNRIEGLPPVINFLDWDARPNGKVGDFVKIYPILADIFLRKGYLTCPMCSSRCNSYSPEEALDYLYERYSEEQIVIASPLSKSFTDRKEFLGELTRQGFVRVRVDGEIHRIEEVKSFISGINIEVVIDRLKINDTNKNRIVESLNTSRAISGGITIVIRENKEILQFNEHPTCIECKEMNIDLNHQCLLDNYKLNDTPWPKVSEWNIEESAEFLCTFNDDSYVKTQTALIELGLNKIAINQELKTLSLSEWQRLRLAAAVSLGLSGLLYMFRGIISCVDERIRKFVVSNLKNLTRQGNTILLVDASREGQAISESIFECRNGQFFKVKSIKQPITESYPNRVIGKPLKIFGIGEFGKIDFDLFCSNVVGISGKNSAGKSLFIQKLIQSANAKTKQKDYQIISEIKFRRS